MIAKAELQRLANREGVALGVLEKDYVLTEVLKALSQVTVSRLNEIFVFKGGTALRKVYFSDWRYSEDLDFTVTRDFEEEELREALEAWYHQVDQESQVQLVTKEIHKPDGYARVRAQFVGPLTQPGRIFMDFTFDEPLCLEPECRRVLTAPFDNANQGVQVYPLEELLAEKMRSILQRGKSRDYYDVWRLLKENSSELDLELLGTVFTKKLEHKGICLLATSDFLPKDDEQHVDVKRYWEEDLRQQVHELPPFESTMHELRNMLDGLVGPYISLGAVKDS